MMIRCYKTQPEAILPSYGTKSSACFDLYACFVPGQLVSAYMRESFVTDKSGKKMKYICKFPEKTKTKITESGKLTISNGERALIPTGLIFDIPFGYHMKLYSRSSVAYKSGVLLANSVGIIDEDYTNELFVPLYNASGRDICFEHGERIAQAEIVKTAEYCEFKESESPIPQKTDRTGGFGSTGNK